jgi:hypothetical protein
MGSENNIVQCEDVFYAPCATVESPQSGPCAMVVLSGSVNCEEIVKVGFDL